MFLPHESLDGFYQKHDKFFHFDHAGYKWDVLKMGCSGATVYGLTNEDSETQAGQVITEHAPRLQHLVLVLGEVDVRSHISGHDDPWISTAHVMQRYREFLERHVVGKISGRLVLANSLGHSLDSLRVHGRAALATKIFNHDLKSLSRSLGAGYLNLYDLSTDDLGLVPDNNIESDGLMCHVIPDRIRDPLLRETVRLVVA